MSATAGADSLAVGARQTSAASARRRSRRQRRVVVEAARVAAALAALVFFLFPIAWMIGTSFKLPGEYLHSPPMWIPREPTLVHYQNVMAAKGALALRNSVVIAGGATLLSMAVGCLAAYSLARFDTGGRHFAFWLLSQRMMPPVVLVVPIFLMLRTLGKINPAFGLDAQLSLVVVYSVFNLPYVVWMMRSYFEGVPVEIEESAMIDGCGRLGAFWRMTLPLSLPGLIATATFALIFSWTEFLFAVVFTRTNAVTLPVVIAGFTGSQGSNWGQASALAVVATAPIFALGLLVQRHFVRGLTLGAVRG